MTRLQSTQCRLGSWEGDRWVGRVRVKPLEGRDRGIEVVLALVTQKSKLRGNDTPSTRTNGRNDKESKWEPHKTFLRSCIFLRDALSSCSMACHRSQMHCQMNCQLSRSVTCVLGGQVRLPSTHSLKHQRALFRNVVYLESAKVRQCDGDISWGFDGRRSGELGCNATVLSAAS